MKEKVSLFQKHNSSLQENLDAKTKDFNALEKLVNETNCNNLNLKHELEIIRNAKTDAECRINGEH